MCGGAGILELVQMQSREWGGCGGGRVRGYGEKGPSVPLTEGPLLGTGGWVLNSCCFRVLVIYCRPLKDLADPLFPPPPSPSPLAGYFFVFIMLLGLALQGGRERGRGVGE